jgi:hypothetical protein
MATILMRIYARDLLRFRNSFAATRLCPRDGVLPTEGLRPSATILIAAAWLTGATCHEYRFRTERNPLKIFASFLPLR